ncbi:MAG: choice-of-anchor D domain-containing protein [Acidobacteriota bacterium]|nr:choice-of-anchor D domain-containing protein [Acidobacteriota bacterium]
MRSIYLSLAIVVLVFVAACNKDKSPTAPTSTATIGLAGSLAFGNIAVGSTATSNLTITNTGTAPLVVTSIGYPTGFSGNFASGTIAAAGSQVVVVTFTPTSAAAFTGTITVNATGASGTNTIAVSGTGVVTPTFTLSGLVTESAPTTSTVLAGVRVTILDGANAGKAATTGADGRYSITGVVNGGYTVTAALAGYTSAAVPVGIDGNTTLNIRLDPVGPRTTFGPGTYRLTTDIPAGRYYSDPANGCHFQRLRGFGGTSADVIVDGLINFDAGQWIVDLLATDAGFLTDANCNTWFTTPRRGLAPGIAPGMWAVGVQITAGTYRADNSTPGCYWQRLSNFTGGADAIIANAFVSSSGAQLVTIASTDAGFSSSVECGSWTRVP